VTSGSEARRQPITAGAAHPVTDTELEAAYRANALSTPTRRSEFAIVLGCDEARNLRARSGSAPVAIHRVSVLISPHVVGSARRAAGCRRNRRSLRRGFRRHFVAGARREARCIDIEVPDAWRGR